MLTKTKPILEMSSFNPTEFLSEISSSPSFEHQKNGPYIQH